MVTAEPGTVGELATNYLIEQCDVLLEAVPRLLEHEPVVHPTRVAIRRFRSTLRTFREVFEIPTAGWLADELQWWALVLADVRDLDVLAEHLSAQLGAQPADLVVGPVSQYISTEISLRRKDRFAELVAVLRTERHSRLLDTLERWRAAPPLTDSASEPASRAKSYVKRARRTARKRLRAALAAHDAARDAAHDAAGVHDELHLARKATKRYRYAVELSEPVLGARAQVTLKSLKSLQDLLGDHQDAVVASVFLREVGVRAGTEQSQNGFTYGVLYAAEQQRRAAVVDQIRALPDKAVP